jgi:uncharacterized protein (DUF433 family)
MLNQLSKFNYHRFQNFRGQPGFKGTRVPVESIFNHLEAGISSNDFLENFPFVSKEQAIALLDTTNT